MDEAARMLIAAAFGFCLTSVLVFGSAAAAASETGKRIV